MKIRVCLIVALGLLGLGSPAVAGSASCVWKAIPEADQRRAIARIQAEGPEGLTGELFEGEALGTAVLNCSTSEAGAEAAGMALGGYAMEVATAEQLEGEFGVTGDRLESAWNGLDDADRRRLIQSAAATGAPDPAVMDIVGRAVSSLGLPGQASTGFTRSPQFTAAATFFLGRAIRLGAEPRF